MKARLILLGVGVWGWLAWAILGKIVEPEPPAAALATSLYKEDLEFKPAETIFVSELNYLLETLKIARAKGWTAEKGNRVPVGLEDYDPELILKFVEREKARRTGIVIPEQLYSLYISDSAQEEMTGLIWKIRQEFLDYAGSKGLAEKYVEEIETWTLPEDVNRIHYYPTTQYPEDAKTSVSTFRNSSKGNYRQLQMVIYASNVYKVCQEIELSGILGGANFRQCRDMALRYVVFHEMTHVLQHAVNVVNAPDNMKHSLIPWLYSSRSILEIDKTHYKSWGKTEPLSQAMNNIEIAKESQAEGVAVEMVGDIYGLSSIQRQLWWEYHFGGLRQGTSDINELFRVAMEWYPDLSLGQLAHELRQEIIENIPGTIESEPKQTMLEMQERLDGYLATHVGYLNPMKPHETEKFWNYLRE